MVPFGAGAMGFRKGNSSQNSWNGNSPQRKSCRTLLASRSGFGAADLFRILAAHNPRILQLGLKLYF
jgi:hypothetical protein